MKSPDRHAVSFSQEESVLFASVGVGGPFRCSWVFEWSPTLFFGWLTDGLTD